MIDFELLFYKYKKLIIIGLLFFISFILLCIYYYYYIVDDTSQKTTIDDTSITVSFDVGKIGKTERILDHYYTSRITPKEFTLTCEYQNQFLCDEIISKRYLITNQVLGTLGGNFKDGDKIELDVQEYILNTTSLEVFLQEFYTSVYQLSGISHETGDISKYFQDVDEPTLQNENGLSDMQIICVEDIISSINPGTADMDNLIREQVQQQCINQEFGTGLRVAFGPSDENIIRNESIKDSKLKLSLSIEEVSVEYSYYQRSDSGDFEEKTGDIIHLEIQKSGTKEFSLDELFF